jgi:uncharacterized membrane protein
MADTATSRGIVTDAKPTRRVVGIDAARGLALLGMLAVHIFPNSHEDTGEPTLAFVLFAGDSAALFVLLAGVGLALSTGGRNRHRGSDMWADRAGLAARAVLVGIVALVVAAIIQGPDVETSILLYFAVYFLLAIPFLSLGPRGLFAGALTLCIIAPILMQQLTPVLPEWSDSNPSISQLFSEPAAVVFQLLLTGTYPALPYLTFILVGLGLGRLNLNSIRVQVFIAGVGAGLAILANAVSAVLLQAAGGYQRLLQTPGMSKDSVEEALVFGPETLPESSPWWLAIATPHTNTPLALASSLGMALLVLGVVLLVASRAGRWLGPLNAMGAMTMTLYTAHMLALSLEVHYDAPLLWYLVQLAVAVLFAMVWSRQVGRGPLEKLMTAGSQRAKQFLRDQGAGVVTVRRSPDQDREPSALELSARNLPTEAHPPSATDRTTPPPSGETA